MCGYCLFAIQVLPLGAANCGGRLLIVHSDDAETMRGFARGFLVKHRKNFQLADLSKYPNERFPRTILVDELVNIEGKQREQARHASEPTSSVSAYHFTNYGTKRVVTKNPLIGTREEIFDGEVVKNRRLPTVWKNAVRSAWKLDKERVRLEFLTPTFVKFKGEVSAEAPSFAALVQGLLIRLPMLSAVHCGEVWHEDFKALVARATEVETVRDGTTWVSFHRYSSFKKKSELLEGVVGHAEYAGPVEEFLPLLCMGQLTHVGKRAVFGLGRYRMESA